MTITPEMRKRWRTNYEDEYEFEEFVTLSDGDELWYVTAKVAVGMEITPDDVSETYFDIEEIIASNNDSDGKEIELKDERIPEADLEIIKNRIKSDYWENFERPSADYFEPSYDGDDW